MMEISQPTVKCVETNEDKSYGKYTIAPQSAPFFTFRRGSNIYQD